MKPCGEFSGGVGINGGGPGGGDGAMQALTLTLTLPPPAERIFEQVLVSRHQPLPQREAYAQPGVCSQRVTQPGSLPTKSTGVSPQ